VAKLLARIRLSKALKNSYVQTAILAIIIFGGVFGFWFGVRLALRTEYPLLAVASGSMYPTLKEGDLIVVQGVLDANEINAAPKPNGTMIIFYNPNYPRGGAFLFYTGVELIVHRAIAKVENGGMWYFQTKGDNNYGPDYWSGPDTLSGMISSKLLVGRVVGMVPWVGNVPLFIRTPQGMVLMVLLFILILFIEYVPVLWRKPRPDQESPTSQNVSVWRNR
jgi:signal peptidase I